MSANCLPPPPGEKLGDSKPLPPFPEMGMTPLLLKRLLYEVQKRDSNWTTTQVCNELIKPWTEVVQGSLATLLQELYSKSPHPELGLTFEEAIIPRANRFVSHAWGYNFVELAETLLTFAADHENDSEPIAFWFDLVVNDQWGAPHLPYEWWSGTFREAVGAIGNTLLVLLPWSDPIPLTRAWCLWEILCSRVTKAEIQVLLSPAQVAAFHHTVRQDAHAVMDKLCKIDLRKSTAWKGTDKAMIFEVVENSPGGFDGVNKQIASLLRKWVADTARQLITNVDLSSREKKLSHFDDLQKVALLLMTHGDYEEALRMAEFIWDGYAEEVGANDARTLRALNNRGTILTHLGRREDARDCYERACSGRLEVHGQESIEWIESRNNLVSCLLDQFGLVLESTEMCIELKEIAHRILGVDSLAYWNIVKTMGECYAKGGDHQRALALFDETRAAHERLKGREHPLTINMLLLASSTLSDVGQYQDAAKVLEEAHVRYQLVYGDDHPHTVNCVNNLAVLFAQQGKLEEALTFWNKALTGYRATIGTKHPYTLTTLSNIGMVLKDIGRLEESLVVTEEALALTRAVRGPTHPSTLVSLSSYGALLLALQRPEEALEMQQESLRGCETVLGMKHISTLSAVLESGNAYLQMSRWDEAQQCYDRVHPVWMEQFGDKGHPALFDVLFHKGLLVLKKLQNSVVGVTNDDIAGGIECLTQALAGRRALMGPEHPSSIATSEILQQLQSFRAV